LALRDFFKNVFNKNKDTQYARFLDGHSPLFSQFGQNVYASDVVQNCIDVIATEMSKLKPRHIRVDGSGMQTVPRGGLNRLFKFSPNQLMTTREFIEKVIWLLFLNYNVFIYPTYESIRDGSGAEVRAYTGFYPLNPTQVDFLQDESGTLFVKMYFGSGDNFTLRYSDVIHLRKKFSLNEIMGGGLNGRPDNTALLKVLNINDTVLQGLEKAVKTSLTLRGILKMNTMLDGDKLVAERERFETAIESGKTGILPMDLKGEYTDLKPDPKLIDKETLEFMNNKVLNWFGVSFPILSGDYTDEQYQAFYEKTLEPLVIGMGQAFSKTLFTQRELDVGNEIVFYHKDMMYLSTKAKLDLLKIAGEQGLLTDNQKLGILGYPPIEGGEKRTMSLNYIDVDLANSYQMNRKNTTTKGGTDDE
jgi:HK97 family phage portal protein